MQTFNVSSEPKEHDIMRARIPKGVGTEGGGERLGLYTRAGEQHGRPVWYQTHETGEQGDSAIFYNCNGFWYINDPPAEMDDVGEELKPFYASTKEDLVSPPGGAWDYWTGSRVELTVTGGEGGGAHPGLQGRLPDPLLTG